MKKTWDLKSFVTIILIITLAILVVFNRSVEEKTFLLFSNITTAVVTYYFTKTKKNEAEKESDVE